MKIQQGYIQIMDNTDDCLHAGDCVLARNVGNHWTFGLTLFCLPAGFGGEFHDIPRFQGSYLSNEMGRTEKVWRRM